MPPSKGRYFPIVFPLFQVRVDSALTSFGREIVMRQQEI